jgi:hypothetical protein
MDLKKYSVLVLSMLVFAACTTASKMNRVSLGMTKHEVVDEIGDPASVSAQGSIEYLNYSLFERVGGPYVAYYVRLVNGKVESYGRAGDFDSTRIPVQKIQIEKTEK